MQSFKNLIGKYKEQDFIITCTGRTTGKYWDKIEPFIEKNNLITIGMNGITNLYVPRYLLFTNNDRIKTYAHTIHAASLLLIGSHIKEANRPKRDYILINYTDRNPKEAIDYRNNTVYGYYRTSGLLAIMIAHLMGARKIYLTGLDSFAENAKKYMGNTHCYKSDMKNINNNKTIKEWRELYDIPMEKVMHNLREYSIDFSIITPTYFKDFYENKI